MWFIDEKVFENNLLQFNTASQNQITKTDSAQSPLASLRTKLINLLLWKNLQILYQMSNQS